jgi:hypothetical protein
VLAVAGWVPSYYIGETEECRALNVEHGQNKGVKVSSGSAIFMFKSTSMSAEREAFEGDDVDVSGCSMSRCGQLEDDKVGCCGKSKAVCSVRDSVEAA